MFFFTADARDGFQQRACDSCCAEYAFAIPGETNKWRINYSRWLAPIRGRGLVGPFDFSVKKLTDDPIAPNQSVLPPTNTDYEFQIAANNSYAGSVSTNAVSPQSTAMTFSVDPINPPSHGVVAMNSDGTFIYVPNLGFVGVDTFYYNTSDGINTPVKHSVTFGVDTVIVSHFSGSLPQGVINLSAPESSFQVYETPIPPSYGILYVDLANVYARGFHLDFSVVCSPEALIDQIYRLTVAVNAMECDGNKFRHISTYDIRISSCGQE